MERRSVEAIVRALNQAGIRYLVVGGLAVVAHGFVRFTADIDIVLDLESEELGRAIEAISALGYRARAPVEFSDFADPAKRREWVAKKGLMVFSAHSRKHAATEIDLFVESPFDFEHAYSSALRLEVAPRVSATFIGLPDLLEMKRRAARPQDIQDVQELESLKKDRS